MAVLLPRSHSFHGRLEEILKDKAAETSSLMQKVVVGEGAR